MARTALDLSARETGDVGAIPRVVSFANGKGGVGKTSCTANTAGLLAEAGYKVLVVDFDPQANLRRDFGYEEDTGEDLVNALKNGTPVPVTRAVRPNLDVVKGGAELFALAAVLSSKHVGVDAALHASLLPVSGEYDFILVDTSPGEQDLVKAVLMVSSAVIIPTTGDDAAIDGVVLAAKRFAEARQRNTALELAGVVMFNFGASSKRISAVVRKDLEALLGGAAPVFAQQIRHLEGAAADARRKGLLVHELEPVAEAAKSARFEQLRSGTSNQAPAVHSLRAGKLAQDYQLLTEEILLRLNSMWDGDQGE